MLKMIPVGDITPLKNYRQINIDPDSDKDFIDGIKRDGVLQSLLVRPVKGKPDKYELISGYRRFSAAELSKLAEVPCNVKDVADDDVLEYQVKENLQRKDVHPMDEAAAFLAYQKQKKADIKTLAAVFVKSEKYIAHRLGLNNLAADIQKDFLKGLMNVSQAEIFAKLTPEHQKTLKNHARITWGEMTGFYKRVPDLQKFIENSIFRTLSAAPFKKDDSSLYPKVGACTTCPKNTANAGVLFSDMNGGTQGRCMDGGCFTIKLETFVINRIKEVVAENPDIVLIRDRWNSSIMKEISQIAKDHQLKLYEMGEDCFAGNSGGKKLKGIYVNGNEIGKTVDVYLRSSGKGKTTPKEDSPAEQIKKIKEREVRSKQIDENKIWDALKSAYNPVELSKTRKDALTSLERKAVAMALSDKLDYHQSSEFDKQFKWERDKNGEYPEVSETTLLQMLRHFMLAVVPPQVLNYGFRDADDKISLKIGEAYFPDKVKEVFAAQKEIADKRQERVNKRIADLQKAVKPAPKKAAPKKAVKKQAVKKPAKKVPVKKTVKK